MMESKLCSGVDGFLQPEINTTATTTKEIPIDGFITLLSFSETNKNAKPLLCAAYGLANENVNWLPLRGVSGRIDCPDIVWGFLPTDDFADIVCKIRVHPVQTRKYYPQSPDSARDELPLWFGQ
jgi:hypothetical protein